MSEQTDEGIKAEIEEKEASLEELKNRTAEAKKQLATAIRDDYETVVRNVCVFAEDHKRHKRYSFLAQLVLRTLERGDTKDSEWEFRTILEDVEAKFTVDNWWLRFNHESEELEGMVERFFESVSQQFSYHINYHVYDSESGLPLYSKDDNGQFTPNDMSNPDFVYVSSLIKQDGLKDDYTSPPPWTQTLYVKAPDIEAYNLFYSDNYSELTTPVRAAALRAYLAGKLDVKLDGAHAVLPGDSSRPLERAPQHDTKLLRVLQTTRERYYGANFDPADRDTLPKQADVVAWLMATYSLSKREAEAIDIVTRPDTSRKP